MVTTSSGVEDHGLFAPVELCEAGRFDVLGTLGVPASSIHIEGHSRVRAPPFGMVFHPSVLFFGRQPCGGVPGRLLRRNGTWSGRRGSGTALGVRDEGQGAVVLELPLQALNLKAGEQQRFGAGHHGVRRAHARRDFRC